MPGESYSIDDVYGPIRGFIKDVKDLKSAIKELTKYGGDLEKIGNLTERLNVIENAVNTLDEKVSNLEGLVNENAAGLQDLTGRFNDFYSEAYEAFADLDKKVIDLRNEISSYTPSGEGEGVDLSSISSRLTTIESDIETILNNYSLLEGALEPIFNYRSQSIASANTLGFNLFGGGILDVSGDGPRALVSDLTELISSHNGIIDKLREFSERLSAVEEGGISPGSGGGVSGIGETRVRQIIEDYFRDYDRKLSPIFNYSYKQIEGPSGVSTPPSRPGTVQLPSPAIWPGAAERVSPSEVQAVTRPYVSTSETPAPYVRPTYSPSTGERSKTSATTGPTQTSSPSISTSAMRVRALGFGSYSLRGYVGERGPMALVDQLQDLVDSHNQLLREVEELRAKLESAQVPTPGSGQIASNIEQRLADIEEKVGIIKAIKERNYNASGVSEFLGGLAHNIEWGNGQLNRAVNNVITARLDDFKEKLNTKFEEVKNEVYDHLENVAEHVDNAVGRFYTSIETLRVNLERSFGTIKEDILGIADAIKSLVTYIRSGTIPSTKTTVKNIATGKTMNTYTTDDPGIFGYLDEGYNNVKSILKNKLIANKVDAALDHLKGVKDNIKKGVKTQVDTAEYVKDQNVQDIKNEVENLLPAGIKQAAAYLDPAKVPPHLVYPPKYSKLTDKVNEWRNKSVIGKFSNKSGELSLDEESLSMEVRNEGGRTWYRRNKRRSV